MLTIWGTIILIVTTITTLRAFSLQMSSLATANKRIVVVGATGYIGKFVVKESVRRGYDTVAFVRPGSQYKDRPLMVPRSCMGMCVMRNLCVT